MYNMFLAHGGSPAEMFDLMMATYLQVDTEQLIRYENILETKKRLETYGLAELRRRHEESVQTKLQLYSKIEVDNQLKKQIADTLKKIVPEESRRKSIFQDLENPHGEHFKFDRLVKDLQRVAFTGYDLEMLQTFAARIIRNNWEADLCDVPKKQTIINPLFDGVI